MDTLPLDLIVGPELPDMDPVRKYVLLVLRQAAKDGASDLLFCGMDRCANGRVPIHYRIKGEWYEMKPFPADIRTALLARLCEMAGVPLDGRFPMDGTIGGDCAGLPLRWRLVIPSARGPAQLTNLML